MIRKPPLWPWVVLLAVFLALVYAMADYRIRTGPNLPLYSCRRFDPYGTSALRELLVERGSRVHVLELPMPDKSVGAVLFMPLPTVRNVNFKEERRRLRRVLEWVHEGNRLVMLSRELPDLPLVDDESPPAIPLKRQVEPLELEQRQQRGDYRYVDHELDFVETIMPVRQAKLARLGLLVPGGIAVVDNHGYSALVIIDDTPVAAEFNWGAGKVVLVADPTPALNYALAQGDNLDFMLDALGDGDVYFDEYSLGLGRSESTLDWIRKFGLVPLLLQALLALILLGRSAERDFGTAEAKLRPAVAAEEQIDILAGIYDKTLIEQELYRRREECEYCAGKAKKRRI